MLALAYLISLSNLLNIFVIFHVIGLQNVSDIHIGKLIFIIFEKLQWTFI